LVKIKKDRRAEIRLHKLTENHSSQLPGQFDLENPYKTSRMTVPKSASARAPSPM
jgi:DNA-binding GntR family transcriptional regulator